MARDTLFVGPMGRLIDSLGAIPVDREGTALGGIKRTMRCLAEGEAVLVFPEGARSEDGRVSALKPGFISLLRRRQPALAVMAVDGAFDAWPRQARIPRRRVVAVQFGRVIMPREYAALDDGALLDLVAAELHAAHSQARALRRRHPCGAADAPIGLGA
jgi:1-acyl-sn-glycerol-3-phosphate acyltransferase